MTKRVTKKLGRICRMVRLGGEGIGDMKGWVRLPGGEAAAGG